MTDHLPTSPAQLLQRLADLGLTCETTTHPPVFTVEESKAHRGTLDGGHCKNLFMKDKKGQLWLLVCDEDRQIDPKVIRHVIGAAHLSFGKPELLFEVLGVEPGSVTPFSAINDTKKQVNVVIDASLMDHAAIHFHPLINTMTTRIKPADLVSFLAAVHQPPAVVNLDP